MSDPSKSPSRGSQITFKNQNDVYDPDDPASVLVASKGSSSKTNTSSKSNLKDSKSNVKSSKTDTKKSPSKSKVKSSDHLKPGGGPAATSTPRGSFENIDSSISPFEPPGSKRRPQKSQSGAGGFAALPYTFRTPKSPASKELSQFPAKCPPYYLQLDHTLAVIWTLFTPDEVAKPLGIVQLQWALSFLNGIYNSKGEHSKDIALCIQTIEDALIDQYAEMVDDVQFIKKPPEKVTDFHSRERPNSSKDKDKDRKHKSSKSADKLMTESQVDFENESGEDGEKPTTKKSSPEKSERENKTGGICAKRSSSKIRLLSGTRDSREGVTYDLDGKSSCSNKSCGDGDEIDELIMRQVPFSINYAEMITRSPPDVQQLFPTTVSSKSVSAGSGVKKSISGLDRSVSRDDIMEFLKAWRKEQVDKIEQELKRLKSIENFIGSAQTENFQRYLDDKQLDSLMNQKVSNSRGANDMDKKKKGKCMP